MIKMMLVAVIVISGAAGTAQAEEMCSTGNAYERQLVLNPSITGDGMEPSVNPWRPESGSVVQIRNESGSEQTLSDITPGLLHELDGTVVAEIELDTTSSKVWIGLAGTACGTYTYDDGTEEAEDDGTAPRSGTIDPS